MRRGDAVDREQRVMVWRENSALESCKSFKGKANSLKKDDHWHTPEKLDGLRGD